MLHVAELDLYALGPAVRRADRARRERAASRPAACASSPPRRRRSSVWLVLEVGGLRLAVLAADRGAEPLLPRAAVPRSRCSPGSSAGSRGRRAPRSSPPGSRPRCPGAIPFLQPAEHHRAVRHARPPAVVVRRRRVGRAVRASPSSPCSSRSRSARRSSGCRAGTRRSCRCSSRSASSPPGCRSSCGRTAFPRLSKSALRAGDRRPDRSWIDCRRRPQRARRRALVRRKQARPVWENEFWNRSVDRVYSLGTPLPGDMPSTPRRPSTGRPASSATAAGKPITEPYVLASTSVAARRARASRATRRSSSCSTASTAAGANDDVDHRPVPDERGRARGRARTVDVDAAPAARGGTLTVVVSSDTRSSRARRRRSPSPGRPPRGRIRIAADARRNDRSSSAHAAAAASAASRFDDHARAAAVDFREAAPGHARARPALRRDPVRRRPTREDRRRRLAAVASAHRRRQLHPRLAARDSPRRRRSGRGRRVRARERAREA